MSTTYGTGYRFVDFLRKFKCTYLQTILTKLTKFFVLCDLSRPDVVALFLLSGGLTLCFTVLRRIVMKMESAILFEGNSK